MKPSFRHFILVLIWLTTPAAYSLPIDGGVMASSGQFPSVVKIAKLENQSNGQKPRVISRCTGTLIAPRVVLTAAHCLNHHPRVFQRISLPGDSLGLVSESTQPHVLQAYFSPEFTKAAAAVEAIRKKYRYLNPDDYTPNEIKLAKREFNQAIEEMSRYDLAFLLLDREVPNALQEYPKISCQRLRIGTPIWSVGFGINHQTASHDANPLAHLAHGQNRVAAGPSDLYTILPRAGSVLVNSGDSGGPLLLAGEQSRIYGVVSTRTHEKNASATYTPTGSEPSLRLIRLLKQLESVPREIKSALPVCK